MKYLILRILIFMVLEYCKAPWTTNGRWRYINAYLFIYLFIYIALSKHEGVGKVRDNYARPRHSQGFAQLSRILPTPRVFR